MPHFRLSENIQALCPGEGVLARTTRWQRSSFRICIPTSTLPFLHLAAQAFAIRKENHPLEIPLWTAGLDASPLLNNGEQIEMNKCHTCLKSLLVAIKK